MTKTIFRNTFLVGILVLAICTFMFFGLQYTQTINETYEALAQEATYVVAGMELSGAGYLEGLDDAHRVTWIDSDGSVLFDSEYDDLTANQGSYAEVVEAFEMERQYQEEAEIACKAHIDGYTDFVFLNQDGQPHHPASLNKALNRIVRDCNYRILDNYHGEGIPELLPHIHCHLMRHTFTTRMVESGIGPAALKELLGHADITTTYNIYAHLTDDAKARDVSAYEDYIEKALYE